MKMKKETLNYSDGDIFVDEGIEFLSKEHFTTGDKIVILLCDKGSLSMKINGVKKRIIVGDILICPPGVDLECVGDSLADGHGSKCGRETFDLSESTGDKPDMGKSAAAKSRADGNYSVKALGMRYASLRYTLLQGKSMWSAMMYARNNPVFHLDGSEMEMTKAYYYVIRKKLSTARDFYYREIMQSLLACAFYEVCVIINRKIVPDASDVNLSRQNLIFKKFIELLANYDPNVRTVSDYADRLCITPKYLSAAVRSVFGKPASWLIQESTAEMIRHDLMYSEKSIKELSEGYGFSSLSNFGKFVRAHLGMSPRDFRRRASEL